MTDYSKLSKEQLIDELILLGDENLILTSLNKELQKQFSLQGVSQQSELLLAYDKFLYIEVMPLDIEENCNKNIDAFLANNCG